MRDPLRGDLSGLSMPRDLEPLRALAQRAAAEGQALDALYESLAREQRMALVDLVIGPRALKEELAVRAALGVLEALEEVRPGVGLYRRLLDLNPNTAGEVVAAAAKRHPTAGWLVGLAELGEDPPGQAQLQACRGHMGYAALCWAHANAGHSRALVLEAKSGRPEPAAALRAAGDETAAALACANTLDADPQSPVVAWLAAAGGPDLERLLLRALSALRSSAGRQGLAQAAGPFSELREALTLTPTGRR